MYVYCALKQPLSDHLSGQVQHAHAVHQVLDAWDDADDSETERAKAKAAAEAKAKADALIQANKKPKAQRIEEHRMAAMRRRQEEEDLDDSEEEDEASKRARQRELEQEADLKNAADLFGNIGINPNRATAVKPVTLSVAGAADPGATVDLASLSIFNPTSREHFNTLRETLAPLITGYDNTKKAQYPLFMQNFVKDICGELNSEQIKKVASILTTVANEKLKEEKEREKGGKKSKAQKTKTTLNASRTVTKGADTTDYNDGLDE